MHLRKKEERLDEVGFSGYQLIQDPEGFCYGIDAVLLANFVKSKAGAKIVDLGTGTGIIPLILMHKMAPQAITGVEIDRETAEMAQRTMRLNQLEDRITILHEDIKNAPGLLERASWDVVVSNPPYMAQGSGIENECAKKAIARHEITANLEDFIQCAGELLKADGDFFMCHRPHRLVDILTLCRKYRLEPKWLQFVEPKAGKKPNIVLLHCVKYAKAELKWLDPICVYNGDGTYTDQLLKIYERK